MEVFYILAIEEIDKPRENVETYKGGGEKGLFLAPAQAEKLLHSLERAAAGIGLHVNALKTEYMGFNQSGDISTLNDSSLKLVDKQCLIDRDRHRHATNKGMDSY